MPPPPCTAAVCICLQGAVPIPGAKDLLQAKDNLGALGWRLRWAAAAAGGVLAAGEAAWRQGCERSGHVLLLLPRCVPGSLCAANAYSACPSPPPLLVPCRCPRLRSEGEVRALSEAADRVPRAMVQNVFQTQ